MNSDLANNKMPVVVLISGSGTNLQALIDHGTQAHYQIVGVVSNRPAVKGLQRAEQAGIPTCCIDHTTYADRELFDQRLIESIDQYRPELLVLAGFMRILTPAFVRHYDGRMLNIHPSLLPKYRGLHTHQRAIDAGDRQHGVSIHFVTDELDGGPLVIQSRVPILPGDNADSLAARVQQQEHILYPLVVDWYAEQRLRCEQGRVQFDGQHLKQPLIYQELANAAPAE